MQIVGPEGLRSWLRASLGNALAGGSMGLRLQIHELIGMQAPKAGRLRPQYTLDAPLPNEVDGAALEPDADLSWAVPPPPDAMCAARVRALAPFSAPVTRRARRARTHLHANMGVRGRVHARACVRTRVVPFAHTFTCTHTHVRSQQQPKTKEFLHRGRSGSPPAAEAGSLSATARRTTRRRS